MVTKQQQNFSSKAFIYTHTHTHTYIYTHTCKINVFRRWDEQAAHIDKT